MAKGNMLLGQARGKVGDVVFSRTNGQQIIRARSAQVRNPQTNKQVLQRILLNTISQAYSLMSPICDHSFEGIKTGADTMAAFMKVNLNAIRNRVVSHQARTGGLSDFYAVTPIGSKNVAINPFIVALGTLPQIPVTALSTNDADEGVAQITLPGITDSVSYADFIAAYGLERGDQVTFCCLTYTPTGDVTFNYARIILDPVDEFGMSLPLTTLLIDNGEIMSPNPRNAGTFARLSDANGVISFSVAGGTPVGAAVIVSRETTNGIWKRSNAAMRIVSDLTPYAQVSLLDAIDQFYSGAITMGSEWYLNNAETLSAGNTSNASSLIPYVSSARLGGQTILGGSAPLEVTVSTSLPLVVNISRYSSSDNTKFVFTTRSLAVGDLFDSQSGDYVLPFGGQTLSQNISLSDVGSYNTYLVSGGYVRSAHKVISAVANTNPTVTAATFGSVNLLTNETITSIQQNQQAEFSATVANTEGMTNPRIAFDHPDQQPAVGGAWTGSGISRGVSDGSVLSTFSFPDAALYYGVLLDGSTVREVFCAINVQSADVLPSGGGASEEP